MYADLAPAGLSLPEDGVEGAYEGTDVPLLTLGPCSHLEEREGGREGGRGKGGREGGEQGREVSKGGR